MNKEKIKALLSAGYDMAEAIKEYEKCLDHKVLEKDPSRCVSAILNLKQARATWEAVNKL